MYKKNLLIIETKSDIQKKINLKIEELKGIAYV